MVLFDATTALYLILRNVKPPTDSRTGALVVRPEDRINLLLQTLKANKIKIVLATPVISEILIRAGSAAEPIIAKFSTSSAFRIASFDQKAALEVAIMAREALSGAKLSDSKTTYAKLKYDRQIVAIAKVEGVTAIYSDDGDIKVLGQRAKIPVISIADLPLPSSDDAQGNLLEWSSSETPNQAGQQEGQTKEPG